MQRSAGEKQDDKLTGESAETTGQPVEQSKC
jgi:hypothetical protein